MEKEIEVVRPKHYNSHKSGIECIKVIDSFGFNLGSSFKYLFRRDLKENTIKDVEKSVYYVKYLIDNFNPSKDLFCFIPDISKTYSYFIRSRLIKKINQYENNEMSEIYNLLNYCDFFPNNFHKLTLLWYRLLDLQTKIKKQINE